MSKYIAGIKPLDTAYSRFEIKPHMGGLKHIKCTVPAVNGDISLDIEKSDGHVSMNVTIPENTTAEVYLPLVNNTPPENAEHDFILVDGYAKFVFTAAPERVIDHKLQLSL